MNAKEKQEWFHKLFDSYQGRLLRYANRWVNVDRAQELAQESFLQLIKEKEPDKLLGRELPWLFCVCRNKALDHIKKEKRMDSIDSNDDLPFAGVESDQVLENKQNKSVVTGLIESLNSTQKEIVLLKFQEDLSYNEISEITGHSISHVGVIIHEAVKNMKTKFNNKNQGGPND